MGVMQVGGLARSRDLCGDVVLVPALAKIKTNRALQSRGPCEPEPPTRASKVRLFIPRSAPEAKVIGRRRLVR